MRNGTYDTEVLMNAAGDIKDIAHELNHRIQRIYLYIYQEAEANLDGEYALALAETALSLKKRCDQCAQSLNNISDALSNYAKDLLNADQQIADFIQ